MKVEYHNLDAFGVIPQMINPADPTPLWEQIHRNYGHGGGWNEFTGFKVIAYADGTYGLQYPGDPVMKQLGFIKIGGQALYIFQSAWVMWTGAGAETRKIARID